MTKGICSSCHVEHQRVRRRGGDRPASYCKTCHAAYMRRTRRKHSALSVEARRRANARAYANVYLRRGKIQEQPCERCGAQAEMHHDDYSRPLDVRWFCRPCHLAHRAEADPPQ